jgi:hypothetical protein
VAELLLQALSHNSRKDHKQKQKNSKKNNAR